MESGIHLFNRAIPLAVLLFLGMLALLEIGRHLGRRRQAQDPEGACEGLATVEGAVFGLLGLLIAFTFSGAAGRFETRHHLIVEESNDIGTAYLRINLLPAAAQPALQDLFRQYLDSRLAVYQKLPDLDAARAELARGTKLQGEIWTYAVNSCRDSGSTSAPLLLLPAINAMIDITAVRTDSLKTHPPMIIFAMMCVLALMTSLLAGYGMSVGKTRNWVHIIGYAAIITLTIFLIVDLEYPRIGYIRLDSVDQILVDLRQTMN